MTETTEQMDLSCPKCGGRMQRLVTGECTVERCEKCFGIWLDAGERLKLMKDKSSVQAIDVGDAEIGEQQDAITEIDCPRCNAPMQHISDRAQKHVGFEHCITCQGSFFDAGELKDLAEFTLTERIRAFFGKG